MLILSDTSISTTCLSFTGFVCLNKALNYLPSPEKYADKSRHKWRNAICSLIHALIVGIFGTYCFFSNHELQEDLVNGYTLSSEIIIAFTGGYFAYDLLDLMAHNAFSNSWPLYTHHLVVLFLCFTILSLRQLYATINIAMILELNSIFLHSRQLLLMYGFSKQDLVYRLNAYLNILSYVVCRMGSMGFLCVWVVVTEQDVPPIIRKTGPYTLASIFCINLVLFYRLIISDFGKKSSSSSKREVDIMDS
ncbi:TLC domain-containing protein 2 [Strongylocentrotus purpuratus]|uniref:TLC domain-containing protein n=1 Tax=Strongylocentrotus purpuratus TaxID=7668 RepID=A0A7M7LPR8_STRPU|nr:TLC domain-containing protein 2 [Strongylocentrotus purpuratus]